MPTSSNDYDIAAAFRAIENELIASMIRNMKRHKEWESDEGFQWEMWQAMQLRSLQKYKNENPEKFREAFEEINAQIAGAIKEARAQGGMDQELAILEAISKGYKPEAAGSGMTGEFFKINDRKMDALIKATEKDFRKAEAAILRRSNDQYRKIIFNAQVYANSGAATYEKAVDMATRDFLQAGLNCIEYSNGSRHTLADYCDMALRTAQKRAYLAGEGEKRASWGIHTVIVNKRGNPCPKCLPFVGKILIDDVYGGGTKKDGPYKLLSEAMVAGLYHPRCRDSHTAYFPEITENEKLTRKDVIAARRDYMKEQQENYCSRQEEKYGRLAAYSLDPENKRMYEARRKEWHDRKGLSAGIAPGDIPKHDSPKLLEVIDTRDDRAISSLLEKYEKEIADSPVENAIVVCTNGEVYRCFGDLNGVWPNFDLGDKLRGASVTHNHPVDSNNEYSFSEDDISLFVDHNLKVLRGVDEKYIYELSRTDTFVDEYPTVGDSMKYPGEMTRHAKVIETVTPMGIGYRRRRRK